MEATPARIPEIGDTFDYEGHGYRVNGWLRYVPRPPLPDYLKEILEIVVDDTTPRLQFCLPEEATHIAGYGVCGVIRPIAEVVITGKVSWSEKTLRDEHDLAIRLAGSFVY